MATPEFDITIGKDGKVHITVHGSSGKECVALTDMVRDIVGKEESRTMTSEYYGSPGAVRIDAHVQATNQRSA
ncbi:MAG TPA: DUF2997 domain-containing protein [Phycisphaerales bacterium]|nr:DUF2997 domain-containing protein [Phycisphaerales bacterium]